MPLAATRRGTDSATDAASVNDFIRPGRDGAVLLQGADIGHLRLRGNWEVSEPARLLRSVDPQESRGSTGVDANRLVELLAERAVVHATAGRSLEELLAFGDEQQRSLFCPVVSTISVRGFVSRLWSSPKILYRLWPFDARSKLWNKLA